LVKSLEGLKERRDNILIEIKKDEERKNEIEKFIEKLGSELEELKESLQKKVEVRNEFDKVITNTESAYFKVNFILI
jgi:Sjoegren syndrome nuclear autoantigen 1